MKKSLIGALLGIAGMALAFLSERFGEFSLVALVAGLVLFLIGSSMVTVLKHYLVAMEWQSKRNKNEPPK